MPDLVQQDLFAGQTVIARDVRERLPRSPRSSVTRKRMAETTHAAGRERAPSQKQTDQQRCYAAVLAAGLTGQSRQEIADALEIPIQTVCWAVAALLEQATVVEPVTGYNDAGRPIHFQRDRRKVLIATIHLRAWEAQRSA